MPLVYVVALVVRATIVDVHPYTAEAAHYALALHLWHGVGNVGSLFPDVHPDSFSWFFWERPLLCLLYWPGASAGFTAFRVEHILVSSCVPVLAAVLLRQLGTRPAYAYSAAAMLCVHPVLVPWSVLVLPDATVAALTLAGLLAAHAGRPLATGLLLLAGSWVKEIGFVTTAALLLLALWREANGNRIRLWPPRIGPFAWVLLPATLLAFLPLAVSIGVFHGAMPGFRPGGDTRETLERLFLLVWLAPIPLLGLALPRVRRLALVALAWPAFFIAYHVLTHKAIEVWYNVVPATMILVAAAATLSAWPRPDGRLLRVAPSALACLLAALLLAQVIVPQQSAVQHHVVTPLTHRGQWDLAQTLANEQARDDEFYALLAAVPADRRHAWTALDMDYSLVMYPMAEMAGHVNKDFLIDWEMPDEALHWWADAVENRTDATFLAADHVPLNQAMREAYAPCSLTRGIYTLIQAAHCHGHADDLVAAYHRIHDAPA